MNIETAQPGQGDRVAIWAILIAGFFGGGFVAGLGLITGIFRLIDPAGFPVQLIADIPIDGGPGILAAHGNSLLVSTESLSAGPLWALAAADIVAAVATGCVAASFAFVLYRIVQRRPFHRSTQTSAIVAGCAIAFGSLLSQGLGGLGQMMAADELNDELGGIAVAGFEFQPLLPIVGFGILALAYVFRAGERLQRDTEGLV